MVIDFILIRKKSHTQGCTLINWNSPLNCMLLPPYNRNGIKAENCVPYLQFLSFDIPATPQKLILFFLYRYDKIRSIIFTFINKTGLSMFETDGPYGGSTCAATNHTHHKSASDSVYWQTRLQAQLYSDLRAQNVFINQPDNYFYWGGSKTGMG